MSVSLEKIPGVESVEVRLNQGKAIVRLKPNNSVSLEQVRQAVEKNGFTPQEAIVSVRADVVLTGSTVRFRVAGPEVTYDAAGDSSAGAVLDALKRQVGKSVLIEGTIPASKDKKPARLIHVKAFTPRSDAR